MKECLEFIKMYAEDQELFFVDFSKALLKLTVRISLSPPRAFVALLRLTSQSQ